MADELPPPPSGPPFTFDGVVSRVFPLRAHNHALQRVCDVYLNHFPEEAYFRPAAPYVMLTILNYGRMSYATEAAAHYGWVSQNEVYFGVPLEWGKMKDGKWTPIGSGVVAPFIFVDQPWSIEVGREVYGWPKEPAQFRREVSTWAGRSPLAREHLLTLSTETFATPYASERPSSVPLVDIDRAEPISVTAGLWQAPLSLDNPLWGPLTLWREALRWWSSGFPDPKVMLPLLRQTPRLMAGGPSPWFYTANLKQIRSLEDPSIAAYQAVTMAPMRMTAVRTMGMLGEARIAMGDPTGGYRIRIHRHPLFPIAETLGLVVSSEEYSSDARDTAVRGVTAGVPGNTRLDRFPPGLSSSDEPDHGVITLAPLFPSWLEADLEYGRGTTVTWRSQHMRRGGWHRRSSPGSGAGTGEVTTWSASAPQNDDCAPPQATFDPAWGARGIPSPPYYYPKLTMRSLALPARPELADVVASLKVPAEVGTFRLPPSEHPHVLMMVTTSEEMSAHVNSAGWWWKRHVTFYVPVIWNRGGKEMVALVSMATFADSQLATTTGKENGPDVIAANLFAPPDAWLDYAGPEADRRLIWLATNVLPALDVDAEAKQRLLVEIVEDRRRPPIDDGPLPDLGGPHDLRFCVVAQRQVRDAADPDRIAYHEWFSQNMLVSQVPPDAWHFSKTPVDVRIHAYPDRLDLVENLALRVDRLEHTKSKRPGRGWEGAMVHIIPSRIAWATLDVTHLCNRSLAVRTHDGPWVAPVPPPAATPCEPEVNDAFHRTLMALAARPDAH